MVKTITPMRAASADPALTPDELAAQLSVTKETVLRWAREKRIPSIRPTRRLIRFDAADVRRALAHA